jgi:ferric-dicitrate binding protein FerR (iron transport regulator)
MRVPALISFFLLCCGLASGCWEDVTTQVAATVLSVKGAVVFGMAEQNNFQPVTRESRIHDGSSVRTLDGARLNLALLPGALLQLSSNSEIEIEELRISKDGNETGDAMRSRSARIRLNRGKITILFRGGKSVSKFTINTGETSITPDSDCLFCVQSDGTTTRLTCARGKIYTSSSAQPSVAIGAGYFQQWPSGRAEPMAATDDAAAQIDVVDSLEIGDQLSELQSGWQNRRPF